MDDYLVAIGFCLLSDLAHIEAGGRGIGHGVFSLSRGFFDRMPILVKEKGKCCLIQGG